MKLSVAIMLGSTTCRMIPNDWNSCALGAAGNAIGIPEATAKIGCFSNQLCPDGLIRLIHIQAEWPWLQGNLLESVWRMFDYEVCGGKKTLEQLVDYVSSIEPQCGDCNRFVCTCQKEATEMEPSSEEAAHAN